MRAGVLSLKIGSLSGGCAARLLRGGVPVLFFRRIRKNLYEVHIRAKDDKKAFAILQNTCYNIESKEALGAARLPVLAKRAAGLLLGALFFLFAVTFSESRVLKVEIRGGGAYLREEILLALREEGVEFFSPMPRETGALTARILSLPSVEFASFFLRGGVLTINVECSENTPPVSDMPLSSPVKGVLEELTVVRGIPRARAGDEVEEGSILVERSGASYVIAGAKIRAAAAREYELGEEQAVAQAILDFGGLFEIHTEKTARGWLVKGSYYVLCSVNLG